MWKKRFKEKKYMEHCGNICPYCSSEDIEDDGPIEADGDNAWIHVDCNKCKSRWRDLYKLIGVEEVQNNT